MSESLGGHLFPLSYLQTFDSVLAFMQGIAKDRGAAAAHVVPVLPLQKASEALIAWSDYLMAKAEEALVSDAVRTGIQPYIDQLYQRAWSMPTSAAVYYSDYSYLAFDDHAVFEYAWSLSKADLMSTLKALATVDGSGGVADGGTVDGSDDDGSAGDATTDLLAAIRAWSWSSTCLDTRHPCYRAGSL